jgi:hypothetical protein
MDTSYPRLRDPGREDVGSHHARYCFSCVDHTEESYLDRDDGFANALLAQVVIHGDLAVTDTERRMLGTRRRILSSGLSTITPAARRDDNAEVPQQPALLFVLADTADQSATRRG